MLTEDGSGIKLLTLRRPSFPPLYLLTERSMGAPFTAWHIREKLCLARDVKTAGKRVIGSCDTSSVQLSMMHEGLG